MSHLRDRHGFTLIELLFSLVLGLVVTSSALAFALGVFRNIEGDKVREEIYRNARFIGMSLGRDIQMTGVGMASLPRLGSVSTFDDTLAILYVPFDPTEAPAHDILTPLLSTNPLPPGGTCGTRCIEFEMDPGGNFALQPGDLARLQVNTERRLLIVESVTDRVAYFELDFLTDTVVLGFEAALSGGLLLDNETSFVQELKPIVYFVEDSTLYRGDAFDDTGQLITFPMAYGVISWEATTIFLDGDETDGPDPYDGDFTNDYDDILGVRIRAELGTNRPLRTTNGEFTREYEWLLTPRNLMYERNR